MHFFSRHLLKQTSKNSLLCSCPLRVGERDTESHGSIVLMQPFTKSVSNAIILMKLDMNSFRLSDRTGIDNDVGTNIKRRLMKPQA